jgi:hypothetical protein
MTSENNKIADEARWRAADALARQITRQSWIDAGYTMKELEEERTEPVKKRRKASSSLLVQPVSKRPA